MSRIKPAPRRSAAARPRQEASPELEELERLAWLLDSRWRIPGTGIRFGADAVAGLLPVVGDAAAALVSLGIILHARRLGLPASTQLRMLGNVGIDTLVGSVPLLGSVFDVVFKANNRNIGLIRRHLQGRDGGQPGGRSDASSRLTTGS